jgi:pimeloyl-ACP methyl ester carboxylesterase
MNRRALVPALLALTPLAMLMAAPYIQQFSPPPPRQYGIEQLWKVTINNPDSTAYEVWLEGTITESRKGQVFWAKTNKFQLPPGIKVIRYADIQGIGIDQQTYAPSYEAFAVRTGGLPEGDYAFTVKLMPDFGNRTVRFKVRPTGPPRLVSPKNGASLKSPYPLFTWTGVTPRNPKGVYQLRVVEVLAGQSPEEAMGANPAWFEDSEVTTPRLQYPISAPSLDSGKTYAWRVRLDPSRFHGAASEVWSFSFPVRLDTNTLLHIRPTLLRPVVLVHGILCDSTAFGNLKSLLTEDGWYVRHFTFLSGSLGDYDVPIEDLAQLLDDTLRYWTQHGQLQTSFGFDIVSYSMGGLIARYYVCHPERFEFAGKVRKVITIGTPNHGAEVANFLQLSGLLEEPVQMSFGSFFLWDLGVGPDMLCIVGAKNNYQEPSDGVVTLASGGLTELGVPVCYVPCAHSSDIGLVQDRSHPSYGPTTSFLRGQMPSSNEDRVQDLAEGMLTLELRTPSGARVHALPICWWDPSQLLLPWEYGVNQQTGRFFATSVDPGTYSLTAFPAGLYSPGTASVTIAPRQATKLVMHVQPAIDTFLAFFRPGKVEPARCGNTGAAIDFLRGPGGRVSVGRFDTLPPLADCKTLPRYWYVTSDIPRDSFSATITFSYTDAEVRRAGLNEGRLKIASLDSTWHPLATAVDTAVNTVSTGISSFYQVFAVGNFRGAPRVTKPHRGSPRRR